MVGFNFTSDGVLRMLFENNTIDEGRVASLHSGPPGEGLSNKVSYAGYARQPLASGPWTTFPQCAGGSCLVTHAVVSTAAGTVLLSITVNPSISVEAGVTPMVGFSMVKPEPREVVDGELRKWATQLTRDLEAETLDDVEPGVAAVDETPGGRFAAIAAGRAATTAPCPDCARTMQRDPHDRSQLRYVEVSSTTYQRLRTTAEANGISMGQVIDVMTQDLGGAA